MPRGLRIGFDAPAVPTPPQPTLVSVTATSATINGVNPGSPAVTMHVYRHGLKITTGNGVAFGNYVVSGLSPATNYSITIAAVNAQGVESAQSVALSVTTAAGAGTTEFRIADVTATDMLVDLPTVANAEVYRVERRTGGGGWTSVGRSTVPFIIANGLTPSTTYDFRWQAETETGTILSAWSAPISGSTDVVTVGRRLPNWIQNWVTHQYPTVTGTTYNVSNQSQLTAALAAAVDGDEIVLQAGVTFSSFTVPVKTTPGWIVIRSSALSSLPAKIRVTPSSSVHMPRIGNSSAFTSCVTIAVGTRGWWFAGLNVDPTIAPGVPSSFQVFDVPNGSSLANMSQDIVIDRCLVRGHETSQQRRAVRFEAVRGMIRDSWIDRARENGADSQAVALWSTPGPLRFVNNQMEGAGENFLSGGADTSITNLVPEDIEFVGNTLFKPLEWNTSVTNKNCFELKSGRRVLYSNNVAQNHPGTGQQYACVLTPRNQQGGNPWVQVADVVVRGNRWNDVFGGYNILGQDWPNVSEPTRRILIRDDLVVLADLRAVGAIRRNMLNDGASDVTVSNVTFAERTLATVNSVVFNEGTGTNFVFRNNIALATSFGVFRSGVGEGTVALNGAYGTSWVFERNVMTGRSAAGYPPNNFFPATVAAIGLVDPAGGNFALQPTSPYRNAGTDGRDLGADFTRVAQ